MKVAQGCSIMQALPAFAPRICTARAWLTDLETVLLANDGGVPIIASVDVLMRIWLR